MSLSSSFRNEAKSLYVQKAGKREQRGPIRVSETSQSLPRLSSKTFAKNVDISDTPNRKLDTFSRLSGVSDSQITSGLFAESTQATRPSLLCVRCGAIHASICVPCSELVCENTLTFYRKTRAAGAAALFNKAFVEAGNSKLVKFFIFRLLRNSFENRKREQLKMKSVVERMFGQNVVYFPFAAWRRYTRESILERKNRVVATLEDRVKQLEAQISRLTADNERLDRQELSQKASEVHEQKITINRLQEQTRNDRSRILGLCNLAFPLMKFSGMIDNVLKHESADLRHYLNYAVNNSEAHNYGDVFKETVLAESICKQQELYRVTKPRRPHLPTDVSHKVIIDWFLSVSKRATNHIDPLSGASLDLVLPEIEEVAEIKDFRSGKTLIRAVVALIWEYHKKAMHVINSAPEKAHRRLSAESPQLLSGEQLSRICSVKDQPVPLLKICLQLATKSFGLPQFRAMDIASAKVDVIFSFTTSLFNAVKPLVNSDEYQRVGRFMGQYENLRSEIWEICNEKTTLTHFHDLVVMWARYYDRDPETGEELPEVMDETKNEESAIAAVAAAVKAATGGEGGVANADDSKSSIDGDAKNVDVQAAREEKLLTLRKGSIAATAAQSNIISSYTAAQIYKVEDMEIRYKNLVSAVDLLISNREDVMLAGVARRNHDLNRDFLNLMGKITRWRDERARGMRFSTELRSYVIQTFMDKVLKFVEYVDNDDETT